MLDGNLLRDSERNSIGMDPSECSEGRAFHCLPGMVPEGGFVSSNCFSPTFKDDQCKFQIEMSLRFDLLIFS